MTSAESVLQATLRTRRLEVWVNVGCGRERDLGAYFAGRATSTFLI